MFVLTKIVAVFLSANFAWSFGLYSGSDPEMRVLHDNGEETQFVLLREDRVNSRYYSDEPGKQTREAQVLRKGGKNSNLIPVHLENVTKPVSHFTKWLDGAHRKIAYGTVFIAGDGEFYIVDSVYPDGRMAVYKAEAGQSLNRKNVNGSFSLVKSADALIMHSDDIQTLKVDCYLNYCEQTYYRGLEIGDVYLPFCELEKLNEVAQKIGLGTYDQVFRSCSSIGPSGKAEIRAVFSDGTFLVGSEAIKPFPESLKEYYAPGVEDEGLQYGGPEPLPSSGEVANSR